MCEALLKAQSLLGHFVISQQGSWLGSTASQGRWEGVGTVLGNPLPLLSASPPWNQPLSGPMTFTRSHAL